MTTSKTPPTASVPPPPSPSPSRRQFLATTLLSGGVFALSGVAAARLAQAQGGPEAGPSSNRKPDGAGGFRLLILGGTGFIGPHMVEAALAKGWNVTIFNRGRREKMLEELGRGHKWIDRVEVLYGNRDPDKRADEKNDASPLGLESLKGRTFDAVIDNSGFYPRHVRASAELLASNGCKQYLFISSISVYAKNDTPNRDETDGVGTMADPTLETMGDQFQYYGPLKALCENAAAAAFPSQAGKHCCNVRPGFIVGPGDTTDRFTYWPWRAWQGGEMLLPAPPETPIQFIDARDLADFCLLAIENKLVGPYNATGPATPLQAGEFFRACIDCSPNKPTPVWVPIEFIESYAREQAASGQGGAGVDLTIWIPGTGASAGFHTRDVSKAVNAGLKFRPLKDTINDTMAWMKTRPEEAQKKLRAGMTMEREAEVIKAFRENEARKREKKDGEGMEGG